MRNTIGKKTLLLNALLLPIMGCEQPLETVYLDQPIFDSQAVAKLNNAYLANLQEILDHKSLVPVNPQGKGFLTTNPYHPPTPLSDEACLLNENCAYSKQTLKLTDSHFPAREDVYEWWSTRETAPESAEVCGIKFDDDTQTSYRLDTFPNLAALQAQQNYFLTHYHACGACSSLQDLAVYGTLDLTKMAKTCSKRLSLDAKKSCMMDIGFTEPCSETWAYNATKTSQACVLECIKEYGLLNLLLGNEDAPPVNEHGELNACLMCDEMISGPGFQYGAGRTRRSSGIISEIERPDEQLYQVSHHYAD